MSWPLPARSCLAALAVLAAVSCGGGPALAAPAATSIGVTNSGTTGLSSPQSLTTTVDAPAAQPRFVYTSLGNAATLATGLALSDSCGDTYTKLGVGGTNSTLSNNQFIQAWYDGAASPCHLVNGGTITLSWTDANVHVLLIAASTLSGLGASPPTPTIGAAGTGTSTTSVSVSSAATLTSPVGLVLASVSQLATGSGNTFTQTGSFSLLQSSNAAAAGRPNVYISAIAPPSTAQVSDTGTLNVSTNFYGLTFQFPSATTAACAPRGLTGVGSC